MRLIFQSIAGTHLPDAFLLGFPTFVQVSKFSHFCPKLSPSSYFSQFPYLMKHKSEVRHHLVSFCNMVVTQLGKSVKKIWADNGAEFQSTYMLEYYEEHCIILQRSCPNTPQQNGVVERKHRHILEIARALRFQVGLPIQCGGCAS